MPYTLEQFRKLADAPAKSGVSGQKKCDWTAVHKAIQGQAWGVKEVWEIAKSKSTDSSISRVRTKRWLDKLVEKGLAVVSADGIAHVYYVNPIQEKKVK